MDLLTDNNIAILQITAILLILWCIVPYIKVPMPRNDNPPKEKPPTQHKKPMPNPMAKKSAEAGQPPPSNEP